MMIRAITTAAKHRPYHATGPVTYIFLVAPNDGEDARQPSPWRLASHKATSASWRSSVKSLLLPSQQRSRCSHVVRGASQLGRTLGDRARRRAAPSRPEPGTLVLRPNRGIIASQTTQRSEERVTSSRRRAAATSSRSPIWQPRVSFSPLKSSSPTSTRHSNRLGGLPWRSPGKVGPRRAAAGEPCEESCSACWESSALCARSSVISRPR